MFANTRKKIQLVNKIIKLEPLLCQSCRFKLSLIKNNKEMLSLNNYCDNCSKVLADNMLITKDYDKQIFEDFYK